MVQSSSHCAEVKLWSGDQVIVWGGIVQGIVQTQSLAKHNYKSQVKSQVKVLKWISMGICAGSINSPVKSSLFGQVSSQIPKRV